LFLQVFKRCTLLSQTSSSPTIYYSDTITTKSTKGTKEPTNKINEKVVNHFVWLWQWTPFVNHFVWLWRGQKKWKGSQPLCVALTMNSPVNHFVWLWRGQKQWKGHQPLRVAMTMNALRQPLRVALTWPKTMKRPSTTLCGSKYERPPSTTMCSSNVAKNNEKAVNHVVWLWRWTSSVNLFMRLWHGQKT